MSTYKRTPKKKPRTKDAPDRRAERQLKIARDRRVALSATEIELIAGPMRKVVNPPRKEKCGQDLERYLRVYSPQTFSRPFSPDHKRFIAKLQEAVQRSLWIVEAVFRGFGKTSITEGAVRWATSYGYKRFIPVIAADQRHAQDIIASIKGEFQDNDLLHEDFPEITLAVRALEGRFQRCGSQMFRGHLTRIIWKGNKIVLPYTLEAPSAGAIIVTYGWTASLRGLKHNVPPVNAAKAVVLADGSFGIDETGGTGKRSVRPDFVMVDDPQTDETARSPETCTKLLSVLQGAILGLGGHEARISVVVPATIIQNGDAIDQIMDPKEYPAWISEAIPMMKTMPAREEIWMGEYARIRGDFDRGVPEDQRRAAKESTAFYRKNRKEMDEGAEATWEECYQEDELSAIQHAMNIKIDRGEDFFAAECQLRPIEKLGGGALVMDVDFVSKKINGLNRRVAPADHLLTVGFIDVAWNKLQWMLMSFRFDFAGAVIDYGEWPEGNKELKDIEGSLSASVFRGLVSLIEAMTAQPVIKSDGDTMGVRTVLVDCGDPTTRDAIFQGIRRSKFNCRVIASRGRAHHQFYIPDPKQKVIFQNAFLDIWRGLGPVVVHDACIWRERFQRALMTGQGGDGGVELFGTGVMRHRELGMQFCSEKLVEKLSGATGEMYKWNRVPGTRNHFLDCAVGCMVAATVEGVRHGQEIKGLIHQAKTQGGTGQAARRKRGGFRSIG